MRLLQNEIVNPGGGRAINGPGNWFLCGCPLHFILSVLNPAPPPAAGELMRILAFILLFCLAPRASAGYGEAIEAARLDEAQAKRLDALLAAPMESLVLDDSVEPLLRANGPAIRLFRKAAGQSGDGYLFAPREEGAPAPNYAPYLKLFKLTLLDARVKSDSGFLAEAEADLLAAAGFMRHLAEQKSFATLSAMAHSACLARSYPVLAGSISSDSASPAYLKAVAYLLAMNHAAMDFMRASMTEEGAFLKRAVRASVTPAAAESAAAKESLVKRLAFKRLQDKEFFDLVYSRYDAAVDERTAAFIKAFETNDPAYADSVLEKQLAALAARGKDARPPGVLEGFMAGLTGGSVVKSRMADAMVYSITAAGVPQFSRSVPRYHIGYSMLGVLRTALAVKAWQARNRGRLPDSLDRLVPDFSGELPKDPFNGFRPFSYVRKGRRFVVYGYGPDRADGGGTAQFDFAAYDMDPSRTAGDIVFAQ